MPVFRPLPAALASLPENHFPDGFGQSVAVNVQLLSRYVAPAVFEQRVDVGVIEKPLRPFAHLIQARFELGVSDRAVVDDVHNR